MEINFVVRFKLMRLHEMKAWYAVLVLVLAITQRVACAHSWAPSDFPDPKRDVNACGRGKASSVCDADRVLSVASGDRVDGLIAEIFEGQDPYARAECGDKGLLGYQVGVALLIRMDLQGQPPADAARNFAKTLHKKWGVGDAACDNGVLLFLAVDDRQAYISRGEAVTNSLTDADLAAILDGMKPALRAGDYDTAVEQAVVDIGLGLAGKKHAEDGSWDIVPIVFFSGIAFFVGKSAWGAMRRRREFRDCKHHLHKLKQEQQRLSGREWSKPTSCPICLEDFTSTRDETDPEAGGSEGQEPATAPLLNAAGAGTSAGPSTAPAPLLSDLKAGAGRAGGSERLPITLACGHTFCEPCIEEWLDHAVTCPICRAPIDAGAPPGVQPPPSSTQQGPAVRRDRATWDSVVAADVAFRLLTLQRRYPTFISPTMVDTWSAEAQRTGSFDWERCRDFQLHDPHVRAAHEARGSSGFGTSFGGGHGGGGGAGSSW